MLPGAKKSGSKYSNEGVGKVKPEKTNINLFPWKQRMLSAFGINSSTKGVAVK